MIGKFSYSLKCGHDTLENIRLDGMGGTKDVEVIFCAEFFHLKERQTNLNTE